MAEKIASELISLPMFPELTEEQVAYVAGALKKALSASAECRWKMEDGRGKMEAIKRREMREERREKEKKECSTAALGCEPA